MELIGKIDAYEDRVSSAVIIGKEDGVIAISNDKTVKVWMKRYTGQYWPSISQSVSATPVCMNYNLTTRQLLVGLDSGVVMDFEISDDYNKFTKQKDYVAHENSVKCVLSVAEHRWILSCGGDSRFVCNAGEGGKTNVAYQTTSYCNCLQFDVESTCVYLGDCTGVIVVIKLSALGDAPPQKIASLKRHSDSVINMALDKERHRLYSASLDKTIIVWNIRDHSATPIILTGHTEVVRCLRLSAATNQLLSVGDDSALLCWDMLFERQPAVRWKESDVCEVCAAPFFWNVRAMWDCKTLGVRQHHCRRCGRALCDKCCVNSSLIPLMGFERAVRTCDDCRQLLDAEEQETHATRHSLYHSPLYIDLDETKKIVLTVGKDKIIKVWDAKAVLK